MTGRMKTALTPVILSAILICAPVARAEPKKAPEPNKMVVVDGTFFFTQGAWGLYNMVNKKDNTPSKFFFSVLNPAVVSGKKHWWIEVGVSSKDKDGQPLNAVTTFLAEETKDGPGKIAEIIVQMKGYEPFTIPSWMVPDQEKGKRTDRSVITPGKSKVTERQMTIAGKTIRVMETQAVDDKGRPVKATICLDVKPLGLVSADTEEMSMTLVNWGDGAVSQIKGEPMSFVAWTAHQVNKAMDEVNKENAAREAQEAKEAEKERVAERAAQREEAKLDKFYSAGKTQNNARPTQSGQSNQNRQSSNIRSLSEGQCIDVSTRGNQMHFSVRGLGQFREVKDRFLLFVKYDARGREGNFQIDITDRNVRAISQRFDSGCGASKCEEADINPIDWVSSKWYSFDIAWNQNFRRRNGEVVSLNNEVWMEVFNGSTSVMQWKIPLWSAIGAIQSARVGSGCVDRYAGVGNIDVTTP